MSHEVPRFESLPTWAQVALQEASLRLRNGTVALRLWERVFTDEDRKKCGNDVESCYGNDGVIGMWKKARGGNDYEAVLNAALAVGFLTDQAYEELCRACSVRSGSHLPEKPHWDKDARRLTYRGELVREVKRPGQATNIVAILDAFEEAGWPSRIDDPRGRDKNDESRRKDVESLNKKLLKSVMRFECDGTGTGFLWKSSEKSATAKRSGTKADR